MPKRKPSKRVTFRANEHDQRRLAELLNVFVDKTLSQLMREAIKEVHRRLKRRKP